MQAKKLRESDSENFRFALRVRHPSMDPADLSEAFSIEPEYSYRAGSVRTSRTSRTTASVHSESYWLGELTPSELAPGVPPFQDPHVQRQLTAARASLSWALSLTCMRFLKTHADLLRNIRSEGGEITLLVTICNGDIGPFTLMPEVSRVFGDLGVAIEFELAAE